jgi:hypothetical protein
MGWMAEGVELAGRADVLLTFLEDRVTVEARTAAARAVRQGFALLQREVRAADQAEERPGTSESAGLVPVVQGGAADGVEDGWPPYLRYFRY